MLVIGKEKVNKEKNNEKVKKSSKTYHSHPKAMASHHFGHLLPYIDSGSSYYI